MNRKTEDVPRVGELDLAIPQKNAIQIKYLDNDGKPFDFRKLSPEETDVAAATVNKMLDKIARVMNDITLESIVVAGDPNVQKILKMMNIQVTINL